MELKRKIIANIHEEGAQKIQKRDEKNEKREII
jgi:hypothetical protein